MTKAHDIQGVSIKGTIMQLKVDGKVYEIDITKESERLAKASPEQRTHFEVSLAGYGIHWTDIDEDLSIDGLIGAKHFCPLIKEKV